MQHGCTCGLPFAVVDDHSCVAVVLIAVASFALHCAQLGPGGLCRDVAPAGTVIDIRFCISVPCKIWRFVWRGVVSSMVHRPLKVCGRPRLRQIPPNSPSPGKHGCGVGLTTGQVHGHHVAAVVTGLADVLQHARELRRWRVRVCAGACVPFLRACVRACVCFAGLRHACRVWVSGRRCLEKEDYCSCVTNGRCRSLLCLSPSPLCSVLAWCQY